MRLASSRAEPGNGEQVYEETGKNVHFFIEEKAKVIYFLKISPYICEQFDIK